MRATGPASGPRGEVHENDGRQSGTLRRTVVFRFTLAIDGLDPSIRVAHAETAS
jgi:hypothetical protein